MSLTSFACGVVADPGPGDALRPNPYPLRAPDRPAIRYGSGAQNLLDLYLPPGRTVRRPLVVYVHGGGFAAGDRVMISRVFLRLADAFPPTSEGFAVASVDYRDLATSGRSLTLQDMVKDVRLAIQFLQHKAGTYGIDPNKVVVAGSSAGGYLATMAAIANGPAWEPVPGRTTHVRGYVDVVGPTDIDAYVADSGPDSSRGEELFAGAMTIITGCHPRNGKVAANDPCHAALRAGSPIAHADASDPRGYLVCGSADDTVPCPYVWPLSNDRHTHTELDPVEASGVNGHETVDYGLNLTALAGFLDRVTATGP